MMKPTAQASLAETAATPARSEPAGPGLGTRFQVLPFQRRIRVFPLAFVKQLVQPTAQALLAEVAEVAATPLRPASAPGLGLGTRFQVLPVQRPIRVLWLLGVPAKPTAHAPLAETAAT